MLVITGYDGDLGEVIHFLDDINITSKCDNIDRVPINTRGGIVSKNFNVRKKCNIYSYEKNTL